MKVEHLFGHRTDWGQHFLGRPVVLEFPDFECMATQTERLDFFGKGQVEVYDDNISATVGQAESDGFSDTLGPTGDDGHSRC